MNSTTRTSLLLAVLLGFLATALPATDLAVPPRAMVTLQVRNATELLTLWEGSATLAAWEKSIAATFFERSRIALKLKDLGEELENILDRPPGLNLLEGLGCGELVLGIYDPGRREVLLAARVSSEGETLAQALTASYPQVTVEGIPVRFKAARGEFGIGAFSAAGVLYVGTTERILKEAATVSAKGGAYALPPFLAARAGADIRLDVNLELARMSPYYRKYWIFGTSGELTKKARLLAAVKREGPGWTEERFFLDAADAPVPEPALPPATTIPAGTPPFWMIRSNPSADEVLALWLGGILKIPAARRAELTAQAKYAGAAFGTARSEESDFDLSVDRPADPTAAGLPAGYQAPADQFRDLIKRADPAVLRWVWDLTAEGEPIAWHKMEGALALDFRNARPEAAAEFRKTLTRILASAYLCNAADVVWVQGERRDVLRCDYPRPVLLASPKPGILTAATSPAMMAKVEALLDNRPTGELSAGLRLAEAAKKYVGFLQAAGLGPMTKTESMYRFLEDVVPSVQEIVGGLSEIRKDRKTVPGGVVERVTYR